jgi:hypothetical protein
MGFDIVNWGYFNWVNWCALLEVAFRCGWEPAGTIMARRDEKGNVKIVGLYEKVYGREEDSLDWDGDYFCNEGQLVTAEDAANLADALERALQSTPLEEAMVDPTEDSWPHGIDDMASFLAANRNKIESFILRCRKGGFHIC